MGRLENLIKKIKEINSKIKIIVFLENNENENKIKKLGIKNIYYKKDINLKNILKLINNEKLEKNINDKKIKNNKNKLLKKIKRYFNSFKRVFKIFCLLF